MPTLIPIVVSALIGAIGMFMLDPRMGKRRRALLRDKLVRAKHEASDTLDDAAIMAGRMRDRAMGTMTEMKNRQDQEAVEDETLKERVRAEMGRHVTHTRPIEVRVTNGNVTLLGPVLQSEASDLLDAVRSVPGVKNIYNFLQVHESAEGIPALQGGNTNQS